MKKLLIYIFVSLFCLQSFSQDYSFSKAIKLKGKISRFKILGRNVNYIIAKRWGSKFQYLDLYNNKLKKITTKEIILEKDEKLKKIWIQPKKGWLIYTKTQKELTLLLAKKIDSKINIKSTPLLLDSILEQKDFVEMNLRTKYSMNERYLATYMPVFTQEKLDYFFINVYDVDLKKTVNLKLKDKFLEEGKYVSLLVKNDGGVVIVFKEKDASNRFKVFNKDIEKKLSTIDLNIKELVFKKLRFHIDNLTNDLIIAGLRLSEDDNEGSDAFFTLKLNLTTGIKTKTTTEKFTSEFYEILTKKENKKDFVSLKTFSVVKIIPKIDGGYLVFTESKYETQHKSSTYTPTSSLNMSVFDENSYKYSEYNYNDIIVYSLDKNIKLLNVNIINKRQTSTDDKGGYSSFYIVNHQNKLNVLFLDEISTESSLKNYVIDENSGIQKDYVFNISQNNVMPVVKMAKQTTPYEVLIPSFLNNSFSIIRINFEE